MPDTAYLLAVVLACTAVTWALRALPFAALRPLRTSDNVRYLSTHMPVGVMVVLAVYTFHDTTSSEILLKGLALAATLTLHLWRRNAILSILGGTTVHVILASTFFTHA